jgi:glyoxylase-like metal-dependent hydrolase (beta-lactamase superfamily II)
MQRSTSSQASAPASGAIDPPYPIDLTVKSDVTPFFDPETATVSYVVRDPSSKHCAIIDPVMDFDFAAGRISFRSADAILAHISQARLTVDWLIETHAHADHLSASPYIQGKVGGKIGVGEKIKVVQEVFGKIFNEGTEFRRDGSQFDRLFRDGDTYSIGAMAAFAMATPGHTPACMTHVIGDAAFVGDTLFMPDGGTARADFPGGDARELYRSIKKILSLPGEMRLFICHDYGPNGRDIRWETTIAEERRTNIHVREGISEDEFVAMRTARDKTLDMPKLIIPSIQVNIRGGQLPAPDASGKRFLKVPLNEL